MARKQSDYLAALLAEDEPIETKSAAPDGAGAAVEAAQAPSPAPSPSSAPSPASPPSPAPERQRGTTLLGRESALARVASGEVRQVTQLLLDPARVRVWPGNARSYQHLTEESCRELIDSIIAEGGQKVPAVVRRIEGDADHDYEVIAGTRRHWSIAWLRAHSYPQMQFVAQVAQIDDEAAFRLADIENRARKDVSDLERARNYAAALKDHYGNHLTRMAERLKLSKGWLSKMLKVAALPDAVVGAFASPADVQLKPAYPLAQALDDKVGAPAILKEARNLAREQAERRAAGEDALPAAEVLRRLLAAPRGPVERGPVRVYRGYGDRPAVTVRSAGRQGVTLQIHSGAGLDHKRIMELVADALLDLEEEGRGVTP
ncbi:ParB/RepB/Spo0J family partition protein [Novosphingobium sp. KCTC 2891]|uniref:ParB/RepB/Spo0J family partition protein n=1 Tax=Novosphingobium sp. KCTC 2891 TaxID=2989730 RepID=UPI0022218A25|nr:ParB/RepB/Spo0J family partition protein [Novosphingobium sp. KCTC 2891]MCW1385075.1 ParB/RepB/Spo0J family partition protein [Novosphingobium sp. KCTC 2891]